MRFLDTPLNEETVRALELGEVIALNGPIITGRDSAHARALKYVDEKKDVPDCIRKSVLYHCGPIMKEKNGVITIIAAGPTTSARMNSLEPHFIRELGIKAIIGKGGMSAETAETMKETGCVYLAAVGGAAVSYALDLSVEGVDWEDLGMPEAVWHVRADGLGPLMVAIDAQGNSLYDRVKKNLVRNR